MIKSNNCYVSNARNRRKMDAITYKGGECKKCGYQKTVNLSVFEFHHNDLTHKDFRIGDNYRNWKETLVELDKCTLLCTNCHTLLHTSLRTIKTDKARIRSERMHDKKQELVDLKGGKCERCSRSFNNDFSIFTFYFHESGKNLMGDYILPIDELISLLPYCCLLCLNCRNELEDEKFQLKREERLKIHKKPAKPLLNKTCPICDHEFTTKDELQKFDKVECRIAGSVKVKHPSKEELQKLILENVNWCALGRRFGVTDNAVRKWARGYGLID